MDQRYALITGASGYLGKHLNQELQKLGFTTLGWQHKKRPSTDFVVHSGADIAKITSKVAVCINLAGAPIAGQPWSASRKQTLLDSRIAFTDRLLSELRNSAISVDHFLSGSAIGIYGTSPLEFDESSKAGDDFAAKLCRDWEASALKATDITENITLLRTGLVFGSGGGFLQPFQMMRAMRMCMRFGNGNQGQSWVSLEDWVRAVLFIIEKRVTGPVNVTGPHPVDYNAFSEALFSQKTSIKIPLPRFLFAPMGEMKTLFIDGQFVKPQKLLSNGFQFSHSTVDKAINAALPS